MQLDDAVHEDQTASARRRITLPTPSLMLSGPGVVIAKDVPDLLLQINARKLKVGSQELLLETQGLAVHRIMPDWRTRLLLVLTHPILAYGLLLEGYNPGTVLPGVVRAVSLLLALYALQLVAVNYAGLALIALGLGLIITEFFMPAFGSLGVDGLAAPVIDSMMLFDSPVPERVALPIIAGIAIACRLVIEIIVWLRTGHAVDLCATASKPCPERPLR